MCGIAGFVGYKNKSEFTKNANIIQKHRGPDNQSFWEDDFISLAHQRLSIIDLGERSNQPFIKHDLVLIYNGELYNYKVLKEELISDHNSEFNTESDTEVIIEAYYKLGAICFSKFIGMFAFSIYNKKTQEIVLVRDHYGIKPLFYSIQSNCLAFASELKTLLPIIKDRKSDLNISSLVKSVNYLWVSGNETMFKSIKKLPAGSYALYKNNKFILKPYYTLDKSSNVKTTLECSDVIENSIKRHMIADVPVCAFLSGGLDSSLISVLANKEINKLETFTITTASKDKKIEQMPDDQKYAKRLADAEGFLHNEILLEANILDLLPKMVYALDEPIGDPAAINTFLICQAAQKKNKKVLLSGMGADELFAGYRKHLAIKQVHHYQKLPKLLKFIIRKVTNTLPVKIGSRGIRLVRWAKRFLSFADLPLEKAFQRSYSYYSLDQLQQLFIDDITNEYNQIREEHKSFFFKNYHNDYINQMCFTDINLFMKDLNLTYTDRASMAASVEVRVPFIDRNVIDMAMSIDGKQKIKKRESKYILKKISESFLPKSIIYRPKAAFGAPIRSWISDDLKGMVDHLLSKEKIEKRGVFNYQYIKKMIDDDRNGKFDYAYQLYQLLTIEIWFEKFIDGNLNEN